MEHKTPGPMTPFDDMVSSPALHALKLMLPYTPPSMQRMLGIYIKFTELRNTMEYFRGFPRAEGASPFEGLFEALGPEGQEMMSQMEMMMNMMEMMETTQDQKGDIGDE